MKSKKITGKGEPDCELYIMARKRERFAYSGVKVMDQRIKHRIKFHWLYFSMPRKERSDSH